MRKKFLQYDADPGPGCITAHEVNFDLDYGQDFFICYKCGGVFPGYLAAEHDDVKYCLDCLRESFFTCVHCGELRPVDECRDYDDGQLCDDCYNDHYFTCADCGGIYHHDDEHDANDESYCGDCFNENYIYCADCDNVIMRRDAFRVNRHGHRYYVCESCYEDNYFQCEQCGNSYHMDSGHRDGEDCLVCDNCFEVRISGVHDYGFKPSPVFHGAGKLQHGVELEIDGGDKRKFVETLKKSGFFNEELFYLKEDGSLSEAGVEIVTNPATLDFHVNKFPWEQIIKIAIKAAYTSHNNGQCGLHVHVSRNYFNDSELASMKLVYLFEKFWPEFVTLSRRADFSYCMRPGELLKRNKMTIANMQALKGKANDVGRYQAVNLIPDNTIEFRLWRGTLNLETIRATLELTDFLCVFVNSHSTIQLQKIAWPGIVEHAQKLGYKSMLKMIGKKHLTAEV